MEFISFVALIFIYIQYRSTVLFLRTLMLRYIDYFSHKHKQTLLFIYVLHMKITLEYEI